MMWFIQFVSNPKPYSQATAAATATLPCQEKLETPSIVKVDSNLVEVSRNVISESIHNIWFLRVHFY